MYNLYWNRNGYVCFSGQYIFEKSIVSEIKENQLMVCYENSEIIPTFREHLQ